jgi:hypothetical protein
MQGREADVQSALRAPDEIRLSQRDPQVYLFYRSDVARRWVCAVAKRVGASGFLITAYRTSNIKEGRHVWP